MKSQFRLLLLASLVILWAWPNAARALEPLNIEQPQPAPVEESADADKEWPKNENPNADIGAMLTRLGIGTGAVLVLCVGCLMLGRPWLQRMQVGTTETSGLKIAGSVSLGNRGVLYLVKVGETQLVAGTDATGLKSLVVLPTPFHEVLDQQLPTAEAGTAASDVFDAHLPGTTGSKE